MTGRSNRLAGHTLPHEGRLGPTSEWGSNCAGATACSCGEKSPFLESTRARRDWHRTHKDQVREAARYSQAGPLTPVDVYAAVTAAILAGLPAPKEVSLRTGSVWISFDSIADMELWAERFTHAGLQFSRHAQPWPLHEDPAAAEKWSVTLSGTWRGRYLTLEGDDPITEDQRRRWYESPEGVDYFRWKREQGGRDD